MITQLQWTGANQREDGTPYLPEERQGYNVYIRPANKPFNNTVIYTAISTEYDFVFPLNLLGDPLLKDTDYIVNITDVDIDGRESALSADLVINLVTTLPKPVTGLSAS